MAPLPLKPESHRPDHQHGQAIRAGVRRGLQYATAYSAFVLIMAALRRSTTYESYGGLTTWEVIAYYYAAGLIGGALFGLLEPWRTRYIGKFLTAYLLLFLVYGGVVVVFRPLFDPPSERSLPLWFYLAGCAVFCLPFAPLYVAMSNKAGS